MVKREDKKITTRIKTIRLVLIFIIIAVLFVAVLPAALSETPKDPPAETGDSEPGILPQEAGADGESEDNYNCTSEGSEYEYMWEGEDDPWRHRYRNEIQKCVENGSCVMETILTKKDGIIVQNNYQYMSGMELDLDKAEGNTIRIRVTAEFETGKLIVINIDNEVQKFGKLSDAKVYFDGHRVRTCTINEIVEAKYPEAKYIMALGEGGAQFIVYIPHFSEHSIEIASTFRIEQDELFTSTNYIFLTLGVVALIGLTSYIYKIHKIEK